MHEPKEKDPSHPVQEPQRPDAPLPTRGEHAAPAADWQGYDPGILSALFGD
jgi:hypothetical protein